ncbi:DMT family transporter [Fictibacillus iocasae]|uniref:DMT family transporter n=1 Tax=Fictibacillus iocasae TaxID=2715437 RepID=A0ABW2NI36_9BACL
MTTFLYLFCLIVWGLNFIAVKIQGTPVSLELSLTYRLAATALLFFLLLLFMKPASRKVKRIDLPYILIFGLCNFALSYLCLYYATVMSSAAIVTLIFSLKVILTPVALRIFLKEPLHIRLLAGGMLGVAGVGLVIYPSLSSLNNSDVYGILMALLGTIITAIGDAVSARNARAKVNPVHANTIGFTAASLLMATFFLFKSEPVSLPTSPSYIGALIYLTVIASFLAWLFYLELVEKLGGAKAGYMVALFPAVGGIASVLIGESELSVFLVSGCVSSCAGAAMALGMRLPLFFSQQKAVHK